ncbi:MAG: hypothetical protein LBM78_02225 [Clostridiales bacterium]|jgi:hypothetical protein|nr:hypothetical protein [Clostridiales bacterium]
MLNHLFGENGIFTLILLILFLENREDEDRCGTRGQGGINETLLLILLLGSLGNLSADTNAATAASLAEPYAAAFAAQTPFGGGVR